MKFKRLKMQNFYAFREAELNLENRGLVLILGDNLDGSKANSNGSGKSAIFDAICWCLWGVTPRGSKGDNVVNRKTKKNCVVSVTFTEGGNTYEVIRHQKDTEHFKKNDLEFLVNGVDDCGKSMATAQLKVNDTLGLDFDTFCSLMPGAGVKAAEMTDKGIKELLEGLLQTELLAVAQKVAKERIKEIDLKLAAVQQEIKEYNFKMETQTSLIKEYMEKSASFKSDQQTTLKQMQAAVDLQEENLKSLTDEVGVATKAAAKLVRLREHLKTVDQTMAQALAKSEALAEELGNKLDPLDKAADEYLWEYTKLGEEKLPESAQCPSCHQEIAEEHRAEHEAAKQKKIKKLKALRSLAREKANALSEIYAGQLAELAENLVKYRKEKAEVTGDIKKLELEVASLGKTEKYVEHTRENIRAAKATLEQQQQLKNPFIDLVGDAEAKARELEALILGAELSEGMLLANLTELEFWVDGFSPKGMRSHMLKHITPVLNARAKHYCNLLTDNDMQVSFQTEKTLKNGKVKEEFNIIVKFANGADTYTGCSSGEKARADMVISLVLGDLASFRANKKIPFRFMDEAFERVDEAGLDAVVALLNDQKDQHETIFVITHKSELKQYFEQAITVVKEKGISRLNGN